MRKRALIPGSYDPITLGHLDIIKRCSEIFDEVIVLISKNPAKNYLLCSEKRSALAMDAVKEFGNVTVDVYDGLLVDYAKANDIDVTVKGIRNSTDFNYEDNMAKTNVRLSDTIYGTNFETLFMPCHSEFSDISSSLVRLLISRNASVDGLVPNPKLLKELLK